MKELKKFDDCIYVDMNKGDYLQKIVIRKKDGTMLNDINFDYFDVLQEGETIIIEIIGGVFRKKED